ncbi:MAG: PSD1 domain-containing protein [Pirellulaceae bacterium]|nr:PSD1 domain-containing protein [Pirellulaceae bacterium]
MRSLAILLTLPVLMASSALYASDDVVSYNRDIRPLLSDRCFVCHGPDDAKREADLRLDVADGDQGPFQKRGGQQVIVPGEPNSSELWRRLTTDDDSLQMPPQESGKKPLTTAQRELFRRWIEQGAQYDRFWSFEPPRPQVLPAVENSNWPAGRIDQFVLATLERQRMQPQPPTDRRTLIRRITLDLTGLPPSRRDIQQFEQDADPDAYGKLVDHLLATPQYGEHLGRYWLDLVRYADTNGMHHDHYRELSQYRDWVIRAFNANMPFDRFVTEQLAGDLLERATTDQQIASGYNRLHMVMDKGTNPPQESYTRNVVDQVSAFGTVFMGMTLECAVCHDHKYDPVKQRDFYQLFAFFNNIDGDPETPGREQQPPILQLPTPEQASSLNALDSQLAAAKVDVDNLKRSLMELESASGPDGALGKPSETDSRATTTEAAALAAKLKEEEQELNRLQKALDQLRRSIPIALVMKERSDVRPAYILKRGAYDQPGEEVSRDTPAFLPPMESNGNLNTRLDLARWITDKRHPLLARVTVNRIWQQFFGVGLVKTSEDFGAQGEYPSHPDLLDDLANTFVNTNWDVKSLVRSIAMSQTYQQSSRVSSDQHRADADNRLLARAPRIRLDSEVIRDQILAISGLLNSTMYGKSVKPPQPADLWKTVSMVSSSTYSFQQDTGEDIFRRSLYTFWKRAMPPPQMTIFDAPTRESCTSRRERTNTPVQALLMMNESQYFEAARHFAQQLVSSSDQSDIQRLCVAFESVTSHLPSVDVQADLLSGLESFRALYRDNVEAAQMMTADLSPTSDAQRIELAAFTMIVNSLFNLDATKTRE